MSDDRVFVIPTAVPNSRGEIGPDEIRAAESGGRADRRGTIGETLVYLDDHMHVVGTKSLGSGPLSDDALGKAKYIVTTMVPENSTDTDKHEVFVTRMQVKGSDGKFPGSSEGFVLPVDSHGFVDFGDPKVKAQLTHAALPVLNALAEKSAAEAADTPIPDRWKTDLQKPDARESRIADVEAKRWIEAMPLKGDVIGFGSGREIRLKPDGADVEKKHWVETTPLKGDVIGFENKVGVETVPLKGDVIGFDGRRDKLERPHDELEGTKRAQGGAPQQVGQENGGAHQEVAALPAEISDSDPLGSVGRTLEGIASGDIKKATLGVRGMVNALLSGMKSVHPGASGLMNSPSSPSTGNPGSKGGGIDHA
jgi:hypothetical protein